MELMNHGTRLRLLVGSEIGEIAREAAGPGILITETEPTEAARHTSSSMRDATAVYEAAFLHAGFVARAHIVVRATAIHGISTR